MPEDIVIERGATVTWTNSDNFSHSVQIDDRGEVHVMKPGELVQIVFDGEP